MIKKIFYLLLLFVGSAVLSVIILDSVKIKLSKVRVERVSLSNPPYNIGFNCFMKNVPIAILKKRLDNNDNWVYDVMILDNDELGILVRLNIPHKVLDKCEE